MGLQQGRLHRLLTPGAWEQALIRGCGRRLTTKIYSNLNGCDGSESRTGATRGALAPILHPVSLSAFEKERPLMDSNHRPAA